MTVLRDQPEILTVEQTAALLQVSKETVYRHIRDGLLIASRIGRGYRVPRSQVYHLLRASQVPPGFEPREFTDDEIEAFLKEDEITPEEREIVQRMVENAWAARPQ